MSFLSFLSSIQQHAQMFILRTIHRLLHDFCVLYLVVHSEANKVLVGYAG